MLNTLVRSDTGKVNNSPVSSVAPVITVRLGAFLTNIDLKPADADNDNVRCRWASAAQKECGSVCASLPSGTILPNSCILQFNSNTKAGWYAASMTMEDYATTTSTTAFSAVAVQSLLQVVSVSSSCITA